MEFFSLTLGVPKPLSTKDVEIDNKDNDGWQESTWRESLSLKPSPVEEISVDTVFSRLVAEAPVRPWLILGEPGAGKSRLLEHWHAIWWRSLEGLRLGMKVPVLVRMRELDGKVFRKAHPMRRGEMLWEAGADSRAGAARFSHAASLLETSPQLISPIWLLDGLDELSGEIDDPGLWSTLGGLPGGVVATCRTAVFQTIQREASGQFDAQYRLMGLKPGEEQQAYLRAAMKAVGFHSLRHSFRDALRAGGVDLSLTLALGGWTAEARCLGGSVAEGYGAGYSVAALAEAIAKVRYPGLALEHLLPGDSPGPKSP